MFDSATNRPVTFPQPEVRKETLPAVEPGPPPAASAVSQTSVRDLVAYWSRINGVPVELALAVAYQESRLVLNPPRGSAGEIGPMQILPERCRLEGYPPSRLSDPQFNIWLGTKLLARYFIEEKSYRGAACKYVAGPGVFSHRYSPDLQKYINAYAESVDHYAHYFAQNA